MHQDIINGRSTVQGLSIVDFHLHFRMPHDPLTRSLAGGQFGADGGADARSGCEEYDAGQAARSAAVARTSAQWRRSWDFADPESLSADAGRRTPDAKWRPTAGPPSWPKTGSNMPPSSPPAGTTRWWPWLPAAPERSWAWPRWRTRRELPRSSKTQRPGDSVRLKLFAPLASSWMDDPTADPVWDVASRRKVPVLIRFGHCGSAGGIAQNAYSRFQPMGQIHGASADPGGPLPPLLRNHGIRTHHLRLGVVVVSARFRAAVPCGPAQDLLGNGNARRRASADFRRKCRAASEAGRLAARLSRAFWRRDLRGGSGNPTHLLASAVSGVQ